MSRFMARAWVRSIGSVICSIFAVGTAPASDSDVLSSLQGTWVITSSSTRAGQPTLGDWIEVKDKRIVVSWGPPMRLNDSHGTYDSDVVWRSGSVTCYYKTMFTTKHLTLRVARSEPTPDDCIDQALLEFKEKIEPAQPEFASPDAGAVKIQDRPIAPMPKVPDVGYKGATLWSHNGSIVELRNDGAKGRWFSYFKPSNQMAKLVSKGTLLFNGKRIRDTYVGTIRRFYSHCGTIIYPVEGEAFDTDPPRVVLHGKYKPLDPHTCVSMNTYAFDDLKFEYIERSPSDEKGPVISGGQ